ncbi:hypothetical protein CRM22_010532 [Opisthorchis felineus]|uniref:Uncharacterized protein n=1 Tax=Opisthorchis felineus TaxID=147828 RepID=A0A4S2KXY5_OPIFE|nr:hypothetical protein CRM22_010532 [Opisthorchis felineus]
MSIFSGSLIYLLRSSSLEGWMNEGSVIHSRDLLNRTLLLAWFNNFLPQWLTCAEIATFYFVLICIVPAFCFFQSCKTWCTSPTRRFGTSHILLPPVNPILIILYA